MFVREVKYYCMSIKRLDKEVAKLRLKLETETDVKKKMKIFDALADVIKTLIRKNRKDEMFLKFVREQLKTLQSSNDQTQAGS